MTHDNNTATRQPMAPHPRTAREWVPLARVWRSWDGERWCAQVLGTGEAGYAEFGGSVTLGSVMVLVRSFVDDPDRDHEWCQVDGHDAWMLYALRPGILAQ